MIFISCHWLYILFQFEQIHLGFDHNQFEYTYELFCTMLFEGKIYNT